MNEQALQARIAELKALADAATPGPWRIGSLESYDGYSGKPYRNVWQGQDDAARIIARAILDQGNEQTDVDADAMFIAAAREAIPALLADLEEANEHARCAYATADRDAALKNAAIERADALESDLEATRQKLKIERESNDKEQAENMQVAFDLQAEVNSLREQLAEAHAAIEPYKRNAERYQALRRGQHWSVINGIGDVLRADELDASIDAALSAKEAP